MSDQFVAEIRMVSFNFAPSGWATCDGQLLPISQNTALFSLLGTNYGGNGLSTFGLPNLQGRAAMHQGSGPGLSSRFVGEEGGVETVTLLQTEIPVHTHNMMAANFPADSNNPTGNTLARSSNVAAYGTTGNSVQMNPLTLSASGSSFPHNNMQPYLALYFVIAMQGIFPPRQ